MNEYKLSLIQLFADGGGALVNATDTYVNAYTGTKTAFDTNNTLSGELKTFYDTELLENARAEMYYAQFGKKQPLPRNTARPWRRKVEHLRTRFQAAGGRHPHRPEVRHELQDRLHRPVRHLCRHLRSA